MLDTTNDILPPRWFSLRHHEEQQRLKDSGARFAVVPAGRRSGKSELAKRRLIMACLSPFQPTPQAAYFAAAPTRQQAKQIFFQDLIALSPRGLVDTISYGELWIRYINGVTLHVLGLNKPARLEGRAWCGCVIDEIADCPPGAFTANIRPTLSDYEGWCWLIGVPSGRGWFYDTFNYARSGADPEWDAFHWISADILPEQEIESARRQLDERTFREEYEASFLSLGNRVYYNFDHEHNCCRLDYDPKRPLLFFLDFNIAPGVAAVGQEGFHPETGGPATLIIGEVFLEYDSNTERVCEQLAHDWKHHQGIVIVFGDATGGAKTSSSIAGSDWALAQRILKRHFGGRIQFDIPKANPKVRTRVQAVNSRTCTMHGRRGLIVDPAKAPRTVKDFEGVGWLPGSYGEIDKKKYPELSHLSDAIGYGIHKLHPADQGRKTSVGTFNV